MAKNQVAPQMFNWPNKDGYTMDNELLTIFDSRDDGDHYVYSAPTFVWSRKLSPI